MLEALLDEHGAAAVKEQFAHLKDRSLEALREHLVHFGDRDVSAEESLDDGTPIRVSIRAGRRPRDLLRRQRRGASRQPQRHSRDPPERGALRAAALDAESVPLNEGLMRAVSIDLPEGFLNPPFDDDPMRCPAVVGGNVETSQRVVDTLLKALGVQACSQGTMNNFLFGDGSFGYYETICGGSGAGPGYDGTSGVHTHMTNTAITDPEILEHRYPVRLHRSRCGADRAAVADGMAATASSARSNSCDPCRSPSSPSTASSRRMDTKAANPDNADDRL